MNLDTIMERSHEGMSSRSRKLSTREFEAHAELEQLKRDKERVRVISPLTLVPDESPQTRQAREQLEQLQLERELMADSRSHWHPSKIPPPPTASGPSQRSLQVMEELEKMKRENEMLKASKSHAPSERSLQVMLELEKMKLENEKLKASKSNVPSDRTRQVLEQLQQVKRENDALKASKSNAPAGMSDRTRQVLEQLEQVKRENDALKASKSKAPAGMSDRTRQVMEQLEKVKRENDALKASKSDKAGTQQKRLAYLEQNHAAASKVRMDEIHKMIISSQKTDLVFLVDSTGSMRGSIDMVKDKVGTIVAGIKEQYPECNIRVAFAPYKDYGDEDVLEDDGTCDFTTSFTGPDSKFIKAVSRVRASGGGGDTAEDVFTGIDKVAAFNWQATNRLIIHIADAPCHGRQFHNGVGDRYLSGDKYGRTVEDQMQKLINCKVSAYLFCHLNKSTTKMVQEFKKTAGGKLNIMEDQFSNLSAIPVKVVALCRSSIQQSLSGAGKAHPNRDTAFVNELVVTTVPRWSNRTLQTASHYKHKTYRELDDMLALIVQKLLIDEEAINNVHIEIADHPFTAEGAVRWPYHAKITNPHEALRFMVVKRFKTPLNTDVRTLHNKDKYLAQMEVQSVAAQMANEFNERTSNLKNVKKVEFTQVTTVEVGSGPASKFYNMEEKLEGKWVKFSNNGDYVNEEDYVAVLQAFTHWTHKRSGGLLMVNDLQGVRMGDKNGKSMFRLCDPAIHCTDVLRFTRTNLGEEGFKLFFNTHKCNDVCKHLGLAVGKAGYTSKGTHCTW